MNAIDKRLDTIDGKQDALDKKLDSAIPKWKQSQSLQTPLLMWT